MARELAAVYSQVFKLAMDVSLLTYCDPALINKDKLTKNKTKLSKLVFLLKPLLDKQNDIETSSLSLELQHLLCNLYTQLELLEGCLPLASSPQQYFKKLHLTRACERHIDVTVKFYGHYEKTCSFTLINDVEIFFKRLNSLFYCLPADNGYQCLNTVIAFLGQLRGITPIPLPDSYVTSIPCIRCYNEAAMCPNQGECILATLASEVDCHHICVPVAADSVTGLFENELNKMGLKHPTSEMHARETKLTEHDKIKQMSLDTLTRYTIFEKVTATTLEISNLIYWNSKTSLHNTEQATSGLSALAGLLTHETQMHKNRHLVNRHLNYTGGPNHFFDLFEPHPLESLFCGGVFYSLDDSIKALKNDCSEAFLKKSNYQCLIKRQNELFVRLNNLLQIKKASEETSDTQTTKLESHLSYCSPETNTKQVLSDAQCRKDAYIQKITKDGLKNLYQCLESQGLLLTSTLTLRVWGSTLYESASKLKNHFLFRLQFTKMGWQDLTGGEDPWFENSKYIKNSLHLQKLSQEHIDILTGKFYEMITGPLSYSESFFPIPTNVALSYCLDAAGMMPHQKLSLTEMIWPAIAPRDWIDFTFNQFYTFRSTDLNSVQKEAWNFVREVVLSTSLYNQTWEKTLALYPLTCFNENCTDKQFLHYKDGVYLTYEGRSPLVLVNGGRGFIFKDLYALLYCHLQLSG
ncbi:transport protein [Harp seal herpesvirus]|uniref:Transport protein n=1 Tax=phocid gammaherpesvirus 3 TaxID=2560643 RepID=A0A0R5XST9_9GAMA|nr:transport protein [Harp seal herpesvirus]AJG42936.1 transport protein [Harp seal herpesvirus]